MDDGARRENGTIFPMWQVALGIPCPSMTWQRASCGLAALSLPPSTNEGIGQTELKSGRSAAVWLFLDSLLQYLPPNTCERPPIAEVSAD